MNRAVCLIVVCVLIVRLARADEPNGASQEPNAGSTQRTMRELIEEAVNWYQVLPSATSDTPMEPVVVLRYVNHARESSSGTLVLWLHQGRPEAAATVYDWQNRICHAFVTLSRASNLIARDGPTVIWQPARPGIEFMPVPDAPPPSDTDAERLREMKALSRLCGSTLLGWKDDLSDREVLRLLTKPLYRYESKASDLLDGAVFAFVQGTDPETLLVLEAVRVGDRYEWQYGFARQTAGALDGRFRDKVVWTAEKNPRADKRDSFSNPSKSILNMLKR
ncbi:MAG: hypothetical protein ACYC6N_16555 [Pirellulaceae bacterium]